MLYSYTGGRNYYGQLTNDTTSGNLTNGDTHVNADIIRILNLRPWPFLFRTATAQSTANSQAVEVPANIRKVTSVKVTSGTTEWTPREAPNREFWDRLNYTVATAYTSDYPEWWYTQDGEVLLFPTPSTARTVSMTGRIGFSRLNIADYTTGQVTTATLGGTAIVGTASTVWTDPMKGRALRITASDTANKGDDEWYMIASVTDATNLTLKKPYRGTSIVVGTATYTIGQVSPIPDGYQEAPIYHATSIYYASKGNKPKAAEFKAMRDDLVNQLVSDYGSGTDNVILDEADLIDQTNPNLFVRT